MPARSFNPAIAALREQIAQMEGDGGPSRGVLPFGVDELDRRLPGGGLALGCLHEVAGGGNGAVDGAAAACFAAGIAARLRGQVLWCVTQADLFAPGLEQAGLDPDRVAFFAKAAARRRTPPSAMSWASPPSIPAAMISLPNQGPAVAVPVSDPQGGLRDEVVCRIGRIVGENRGLRDQRTWADRQGGSGGQRA